MVEIDAPPPPMLNEPSSGGDRQKRVVLAAVVLAAATVVVTLLVLRVLGESAPSLPGIGGPGEVPHYVTSAYGVTRPLGVAVSTSGNRVYVTESDGKRAVRVFDAGGKPTGSLQWPGAAAAHVPVYVAVDPLTDDVYVSERMTQAVYVFGPTGAFRHVLAPELEDLGGGWQPLGLTFDQRGLLYVTDVSGPVNRIVVLRRNGSVARVIGAGSKLSFPNGLAIDPRGNVYATDSNNGRLVIFTRSGKLAAAVNRGTDAGNLGLPRGVAIDGQDRLYVVDTTGHAVHVYRLADAQAGDVPRFVGNFGLEGVRDGAFEYPNGVAVGTHGRIYVTDRENNRIQIWSY